MGSLTVEEDLCHYWIRKLLIRWGFQASGGGGFEQQGSEAAH